MQQILMTPVNCNIVDHQDEVIQVLCLNSNCKHKSALCLKCLFQNHSQCLKQTKYLKDIPNELAKFKQLQDDVVALQQNVNEQFKVVFSELEQILKPISEYIDIPNLTNLHQIGAMMRDDTEENIIVTIRRSIYSIKSILDKFNCFSEITHNSYDFWKDKGQKLREYGLYDKAIVCFDKAIQLDPKNLRSYYFKIHTLQRLGKSDEAIDCYNKAIQLKPDFYCSWLYKGDLLYELNRYLEAMNCYDMALIFISEQNDVGDFSKLEQLDSVIGCYEKIIEGKPDFRLLTHVQTQLKLAKEIVGKIKKIKPRMTNNQIIEYI